MQTVLNCLDLLEESFYQQLNCFEWKKSGDLKTDQFFSHLSVSRGFSLIESIFNLSPIEKGTLRNHLVA